MARWLRRRARHAATLGCARDRAARPDRHAPRAPSAGRPRRAGAAARGGASQVLRRTGGVVSGAWTLAVHSLRRKRVLLIGLGLVLAGFQFLLTQVAVYLMKTQAFGMLANLVPEFMRSLAGPSMLM